MTRDTHLYGAAERGGQLQPGEEAACAGHAGAVVGVAVGGVAAEVRGAVRRAARAVAHAAHAAADQGEAVAVQHGVDRPQAGIAHLHHAGLSVRATEPVPDIFSKLLIALLRYN